MQDYKNLFHNNFALLEYLNQSKIDGENFYPWMFNLHHIFWEEINIHRKKDEAMIYLIAIQV